MQAKVLGRALRGVAVCTMVLGLAACSGARDRGGLSTKTAPTIDPELLTLAISEAHSKRTRGVRVWCVPFARDASGVQIRGNANTWWGKAKGHYARDHAPHVGAVMAFSGTHQLPMGHVAVVSKVLSEREILISHANWKRNQVTLDMPVMDISENNDWSRVRVMSVPGHYGRPYAVDGFILPVELNPAPAAEAVQYAAAQ